MKLCLLLIAISTILPAQAPPPAGPDTVVFTVAGKAVTVSELQRMIAIYPPAFGQQLQKDAAATIRDAFVAMHLAQEGDKLKLGEESPLKEQLEIQRKNMIANAMVTHERNFFNVTPEDVDRFYQRNQTAFQQTDIKIVKISFKPPASSAKTVEELAQQALEAAHTGTNRSEADAQKLAAEIVDKLRKGADFAQMVAQYSDDAESKAAGGDFGTVKPSSNYTDEFKKAVLALKEGQVSDPIASKAPPALYIVRAEKVSVQPLSAVRELIMDELKNAHLREFVANLQKQFTPVIERPDVLIQMNAARTQRPPAK